MVVLAGPQCGPGCRSREHGSQITAAIIRGTEAEAIAYMKSTCHRSCFVVDESGKTALHTAASCGKSKVVRWLLMQGASLNPRDWESGYTPLHRALFYGHLHIACALIQAGCNISLLDYDALTPLDHVKFDRPPIVSFTCSLPTHVYVWGNNANYNIGQYARDSPKCLELLHREGQVITNVALNKFHTLFLTTSGRVYSCGLGHGGRLGIDISAPVINPRPVKALFNTNVIQVAVGQDHSLFLTDSGQVLSCGVNTYHQLGLNPPPEHVYTPRLITWHKSHKEEVIGGISAAKYHSVMWTSKVLYTFGLNAGQVGHIRNTNEQTIINPRKVTSIVLREEANLACIGVSDGATVVTTSFGDIYVLHQYQTRKIASKMLGIVKVACIGGHLDSQIGARGITEKGGSDLKIAVLTGGGIGHLYIWTEQSLHLSRCMYSISREINLVNFCLNQNSIGLVTDDGEAFSAVILPPRERKNTEKSSCPKPWRSSGQLIEFVDRNTCTMLRLTRIAALHRTIAIMCDPKGQNFAALQNDPNSFLTYIPEVSPRTMKEDLGAFLEETSEMDMIHDVVIKCGNQSFPAHSFILSCHSQYFRECLIQEPKPDRENGVNMNWNGNNEDSKKTIVLEDVPSSIFQEFLTYMYTGSCQLTSLGHVHANPDEEHDNDSIDTNNMKNFNDWIPKCSTHKKTIRSVYDEEKQYHQATSKQKRKRSRKISEKKNVGLKSVSSDPIRMAKSVAKKLGISALVKELDSDQCFRETDMHGKGYQYKREDYQELWDVMICSKNGDLLGAHKCMLAARLQYFQCMFGTNWIEATSSKSLTMPLPTNFLSLILDYLYEEDSPKLRQCRDPEFVCNVFTVADQFLMTRLCELCELVLAGLLTLKNAAELLEFAAIYNAEHLKTSAMQFICLNLTSMLENGSLLTIGNSEVLMQLSNYYRNFIPRMACRVLTPHDHPPYANELVQLLEENPLILPESDEEWDDSATSKYDKQSSTGGSSGSVRKKKRTRRSSQGENRSRRLSSSSSECDTNKDVDDSFETLTFDDLAERAPMESPESPNIKYESADQGLHSDYVGDFALPATAATPSDPNPWHKVGRKKSSSTSATSPTTPPLFLSCSPTKDAISTETPEVGKAVTQMQTLALNSAVLPRTKKVEDESPITDFPNLTDSPTAFKVLLQPKNNKMGKLSQKQRKKLAAAEVAAKSSSTVVTAAPAVTEDRKTLIPNSSWGTSSPAWGFDKKSIVDVDKNGNASCNLADIIKAEEASAKTKSNVTPVAKQIKKKSPDMAIPTRRSWGNAEAPQRTSESEGGAWNTVAGSPPAVAMSSSLPSPGHHHPDGTPMSSGFQPSPIPSFSKIVQEEEIHFGNLLKERSKPLAFIQIEDKAIEELLAFYGASECCEERITVTRVRTCMANPTWSK